MIKELTNYNWPIDYSVYKYAPTRWSPYIYPRFRSYEELVHIDQYQQLNPHHVRAATYNWVLGQQVDVWV